MTIIISNNEENSEALKELLNKIDDIKPELDLYSVLVDEQISLTEV